MCVPESVEFPLAVDRLAPAIGEVVWWQRPTVIVAEHEMVLGRLAHAERHAKLKLFGPVSSEHVDGAHWY
jgi:hypothetical protein